METLEFDETLFYECSECDQLFTKLDEYNLCPDCAENWEKEKKSIEATYESLNQSMR